MVRWTTAVLTVAEAVLCGSLATVEGVGRVTGLSAGACTNALRALAEQGLVVSTAKRSRASARRVADVDALLEAYAAQAVARLPAPSLRIGVAWQDVILGLREIGRGWTRGWSRMGRDRRGRRIAHRAVSVDGQLGRSLRPGENARGAGVSSARGQPAAPNGGGSSGHSTVSDGHLATTRRTAAGPEAGSLAKSVCGPPCNRGSWGGSRGAFAQVIHG